MSVGAVPSGLIGQLLTLHDYPVIIALIIAGALSVGVLIVSLCLRAYGEVYEAVYDLKRRCASARRRFREDQGTG